MPGRRPIFASLVSKVFIKTRDFIYKSTLEPESPAMRRAKRLKKSKKKNEKDALKD